VGPWFAILCLDHDPVHLDPMALDWWRSIGARIVHVSRSRSHPIGSATNVSETVDVLTVEDVDGAFRDWRLARPGDEVIVLRPDRYVAATCSRGGFASTTHALRVAMGQQIEERIT